MRLRILTYNLHLGAGWSGSAPDAVASALAMRDPDVIVCQEALAPNSGSDHASVLASALEMRATWMPNATVAAGKIGNAILTERPLLAVNRLDVSVLGVEPRGVLRCRLSHGLQVWNVHLGLSHRERRAQWQAIERVLPPPDVPLVVCGDFNDWSGRLDARIRIAGLHNVLESVPRRRRRTFPSRIPLFSLDRIYYRSLVLKRAAVLGSKPWARLSDHLPVEADFLLAPRDGAGSPVNEV